MSLEKGPLRIVFGHDDESGALFLELVRDRSDMDTGQKVDKFDLRGPELRAFAQLVELARPELRKVGGPKA